MSIFDVYVHIQILISIYVQMRAVPYLQKLGKSHPLFM